MLISKHIKARVVLVALLVTSVASTKSFADIEAVQWPILQDGRDVFVSGELYRDTSHVDRNLKMNLSSNKDVISTLSSYYNAARSNDVKSVERLYDIKDGSRDRFARNLAKTPDMYLGFSKLARVELGEFYYWGNYVLASVEWFDRDQRLANWREGIACEEYCYLTNLFLYPTPEVDAYSAGLYSLASSSATLDARAVKRSRLTNEVTFLPSARSSQYPFHLRFKIKEFPTALILDREAGGDQAKKAAGVKADHQVMFEFIADVWGSRQAVEQLLADENAEQAQVLVDEVFSAHWRNYQSDLLMPMYEFGSEGSVAQSILLHTPFALFRKLGAWKQVEALGYMRSEAATYLLVRGTDEQDKQDLQIFYVQPDSQSVKLLNASVGEIAVENLIKTPQFGAALAKTYIDKFGKVAMNF